MRRWTACIAVLILTVAITSNGHAQATDDPHPVVLIQTSLGEIEVQLRRDKAPISVANFLQYAEKGHYDGTVFHRVIKGFMIQGGGLDAEMQLQPTDKPIKNEADNGLLNRVGTIAMARTGVVDSATSQFFINTNDNKSLNHSGPGSEFGYAVFGEVIAGMDVVKEIEASATGTKQGIPDVPIETVLITSVKRK